LFNVEQTYFAGRTTVAAQNFDVIVIGAGPGGYVAAIRASQLGLKVAIVEREHMGGICLNWGCIPTKAMLRSSEVFHLMHRAKDFGLSADNISYDLDAVVKRSRGVAKQLNSGVGHLMKKNKVTVFMGEATLPAKGKVSVKTDKGTEELTAKNIILATGARARELPGLEADGKRVWTYKAALTPPHMPGKLLVIGSGAIGIEFASFYNTLGADTTVVEVMDRILPVEDEEISTFARKSFEKQGMKIMSKAMVKKLDRAADKVTAHIEVGGKVETHEFDTVISAVGIVANTEGLGLEKLGAKIDRSFVVTDEYCRTGVEGLFVIGDATNGPGSRTRPPTRASWWPNHRGQEQGPPGRAREHRRLHLLPPAGRLRRSDRGQGEGAGLHHPRRPLPLHRQRQGHRAGRTRGHDQDCLRRQDRGASGRTHDRRGGHGTDPGLHRRQEAGDDRRGPDGNRLPASDALRDDARKRARRL
jgi:pyruvate/2-oxoglutarate dehydrogenase complex dihydrolipoamide dehydrogenase (E3) component